MSWQQYIDTLKAPDHNNQVPVAEAAICGIAPGSEGIWASTPGLASISVDEIKKLAGRRDTFAQNGVHIAGQRCRLIRDQMDMESVYTLDLKTAADANGDTFGVCVGRSLQAIVIAKGTKEASGGQLSSKVFTVVDYLRKSKF
ncbi:Profilin-1 [Oryzias melastigma]|uniref:Profilin n=1 Tax=Oryzias melastigma TaxID=30732 RepID=A0A3B3BKS7_ORYME|nr:profilin-1 [Oryzias melastigma]KAF6720248.1 Profilin-1 [Oryzias melastigma]